MTQKVVAHRRRRSPSQEILEAFNQKKLLKALLKYDTKTLAAKIGVSAWILARYRSKHFNSYLPEGRWKEYLPGYYVSDKGQVWSVRLFGIMTPQIHNAGYSFFTLKGRSHFLHRMMLTVFKRPPSPGEKGRHLDDDTSNNTLDNLSWGTHKDNMQDKVRNGKSLTGEKHFNAAFTEEIVLELRREYTKGNKKLLLRYAKRYNVNYLSAYNAATKRSWRHLNG